VCEDRLFTARRKRPPVNAVPIMVSVPPAELEPIDAWIKRRDPAMSRPEAIRRLCELGLKVKPKG